MKKIGVLGGTFDPIHNGHLALAEEVSTALGLDEVVFIPAGQPQLRGEVPVSPAEHRVAMVRLAIAGKPYFRLSTMEIERVGPTYTVDTMTELGTQPGSGDELFFILGWDSLAELPHWMDPAGLIARCRLVAVPRPGCALPDLEMLEAEIPGLTQRVILLDRPEIDISASAIRDRVSRGQPIGHLVPGAVAEYIARQKLYLAPGGVS